MAAVECRDRKNIHEGKDNAQECRHLPEHIPVPKRREEASYGPEAAEALCAIGREEILEVAHVAFQRVDAVADARRNAFEETVADVGRLVVVGKVALLYSKLQVRREHHGSRVRLCRTLVQEHQADGTHRQRVLSRLLGL